MQKNTLVKVRLKDSCYLFGYLQGVEEKSFATVKLQQPYPFENFLITSITTKMTNIEIVSPGEKEQVCPQK